ncbi:N-acetylneuraminate synthase family protein [Aurantimicrobium minutum]|uniref:N-acetylneuraminate synthase family protein n=1 Tax=Aurantimicrobium minutum TaxID=708131 RepID=UPI002473632C|nr:N-acetylneuraminate synthase family protein [Aurantimicrobium minutum]MDH6256024.1 N,N'-diacetyllegionaminate synthase [Aurantimicrobium minutum]
MSQNQVTVIAEIGVNHNGDIELAKRIVDEFVNSGADYLKFQTGTPELILLDSAPKAKYQEDFTGKDTSAMEMIKSIVLTMDQYREMHDYVKSVGGKFLSTAFDLPSVSFLHDLGLRLFKVPSGEITNLPYLKKISQVAEEIIISTGMSTLSEVELAIETLEKNGIPRGKITVLQCNTAYPSPLEDTNLLAMVKMGEYFGTKFGYSDHTEGSTASLAAVSMGATVIEKHVTVDRTLPGPDQHASMEPTEFKTMVKQIREIGLVMGNPDKKPTDSEKMNKHVARRGVYFSRAIESGQQINENDLICLRPENGFSPMDIEEIIGSKLNVQVEKFSSVNISLFTQ